MRTAFEEGIAWGEAKERLFEHIDAAITPLRERYHTLIAEPAQIEERLLEGAEKARALASPFLDELRHAVGLRSLAHASAARVADQPKTAVLPQFKQYREADGRFYFKLVDGEGRLLLHSVGFDSPRDAGRWVAQLRQGAAFAVKGDDISVGGTPVATLAEGAGAEELRAALAALAG